MKEQAMTVKSTHVETIETDPEMQPETVLKELRRLANSPADIIQKYIVLAVLILFGAFTWFAWQQNAQQPERLYVLLEKSVTQQGESLRIQEQSLAKLQEFAIRVPIEHADHTTRLTAVSTDIMRLTDESSRLKDAVLANTEAIGRLVKALEENAKRNSGT
jgi:cytoskeletal protein RodZ